MVTGQGKRVPRRGWRGRNGLIALAATATLGVGLITGSAPAYAAENPLGDLGLGDITGLLENEILKDYLTICDNPDGSTPVPDADNPPVAVADCSQSTGTGIAVVLPESVEVGTAAEGLIVDVPLFGNRNLIEIVSAAAIDPWGGAINPFSLGKYKTFEQVQRDAALEANVTEERYCTGTVLFGRCVGGSWKVRTIDTNLKKRTEALKVAEYLTGQKYDYTKPVVLPGKIDPVGSATVAGPGTQLALAMTGGTALAETAHKLGIATAGAGGGRNSNAYSYIGMANALNLDTDQIDLTWFGQKLDFTKLKKSGLLGLAGDDAEDMIGTIEDLKIPALKEVSCYGVYATATADGLGSCTNVLGTFDMFKDLRAPKVGESRQTQYGLTDVTSLVMGNDALLKQLNGTSETTPFMDDLMKNLTSEDDRLKFAKDFVRFTQDVKTVAVEQQKVDEDGELVFEDGEPVMVPKLDEDGNPVTKTISAAYLTSDYGLRNPVTIEWMGHRVVLFPAVTVNGQERPNFLSLPQIEKIVADADSGALPKISLLPKVSLVQIDNPFGLGTLTLDKPFNLVHTVKNYLGTVTIVDDLKQVGDVVGGSTGTGSTGGEKSSDDTKVSKDAVTTDSDAARPASKSTANDAATGGASTGGATSSEVVKAKPESASTESTSTESADTGTAKAGAINGQSSKTETTKPAAPATTNSTDGQGAQQEKVDEKSDQKDSVDDS